MDKQKIDLILNRLLEQTESGKLDWKETSDENTYLLILKDSSISLHQSFLIYTCSFRNADGNTVDSIVSSPLAKDDNYEKLNHLHSAVKRKLSKTDETIDSILEQLAA